MKQLSSSKLRPKTEKTGTLSQSKHGTENREETLSSSKLRAETKNGTLSSSKLGLKNQEELLFLLLHTKATNHFWSFTRD
jgi:hypothetical protein